MNLELYHQKKAHLLANRPKYRTVCQRCQQPDFGCYCHKIKAFDPQISFVILIHPIEVKRRIATGRMSHLCLKNSYLIEGQDFSHNPFVLSLVEDKNYHSVLLYPGKNSKDLTELSVAARQALFPIQKKVRIFVIDGTWATAKKMIRQSSNLQLLPRICFSSPTPSNFRVRKQPQAGYYSTIEAIHHTIELLQELVDPGLSQTKPHNNLLEVFGFMVERQLEFIRTSNENQSVSNLRRYGPSKKLQY